MDLYFDSSTNYIKLVFIWIAILTFLPGLVTNYGEKYLPSIFLQVFRYGRANVFTNGKESKALKKLEVPKKWFYHCYLFGVFFQSLILYTVISSYGNGSNKESWLKTVLKYSGGNERNSNVDATTTVLALSLFLFQLSRRLYETLFVCVYSDTKMNLLHYILTWVHYLGSMLSLPAFSPIFASTNDDNKFDTTLNWRNIGAIQYIALLIFIYGSWVTYQTHVALGNLRKGKDNQVVSMKHQIPRGGLFETISSPNYWGEILVYSAIALLFKFRNYTWNYVTIWVIANQVIVGIMNHNWYLKTFPEYPKNRKAVIPYVW